MSAGLFAAVSCVYDGYSDSDVYWHNDSGNEEDKIYPAHSGSIWVWADGDDASTTLYDNYGALIGGQTFSFYIVVGVVRKEINITAVLEEEL